MWKLFLQQISTANRVQGSFQQVASTNRVQRALIAAEGVCTGRCHFQWGASIQQQAVEVQIFYEMWQLDN